jgi:hypothetical protein
MSDSGSADRLLSEANAKLSSASKGGFFSFGPKSDKYEEAADKFRDAGMLISALNSTHEPNV